MWVVIASPAPTYWGFHGNMGLYTDTIRPDSRPERERAWFQPFVHAVNNHNQNKYSQGEECKQCPLGYMAWHEKFSDN